MTQQHSSSVREQAEDDNSSHLTTRPLRNSSPSNDKRPKRGRFPVRGFTFEEFERHCAATLPSAPLPDPYR
jgi:hypothetical protein